MDGKRWWQELRKLRKVGTFNDALHCHGNLAIIEGTDIVARALKEMGRIEKTIFLLKYMSNESLRREILVGLNKGEAMNGLARALFFGKSGNLREKDLQDQLQRASCLNILLNVVVIWNTVYLSRAIEHKRQTTGLDESMLKHISPLNWNHIQLYGKYYFNEASSLENDQYRDLRLPEPESPEEER